MACQCRSWEHMYGIPQEVSESPHDKHRTRAVLNNLHGDAAEEKPGDRAKALGTEDNEIDLVSICDLDDLLGGLSDPQRFIDSVSGLQETGRISVQERQTGFFQRRMSHERHDMDQIDFNVLRPHLLHDKPHGPARTFRSIRR